MKGYTNNLLRRSYRIKSTHRNVLNIEEGDGLASTLLLKICTESGKKVSVRLNQNKVKDLVKLLNNYIQKGTLPAPKKQEPLKEGKIY